MQKYLNNIYKEKLTLAQQYQELQDLINIISTTAKLIGYNVGLSMTGYTTILETQLPNYKSITLFKNDNNTIILKTTVNINNDRYQHNLTNLPHEQKINQLNEFLQTL